MTFFIFAAAPRVTSITEDGCMVDWASIKVLPSQGELHYQVQLTKVKESDSKIVSVYSGIIYSMITERDAGCLIKMLQLLINF